MDEARALDVVAEVVAAVDQWRHVAFSRDVGLRPDELDDFAPAFEHAQLDTAQALLRR